MWVTVVRAFLTGILLALCGLSLALQQQPELQFALQSNLMILFVTLPFQSLLEEILFRSFLLKNILLPVLKNQWAALIFTAALFSAAHFLNYRLAESQALWPRTLLTLFFLGFAGNVLFVLNGHLGGSWGLHVGWNLVRFALSFSASSLPVSEAASFNVLEGSWGCVVLSFVLAALAFVALAKKIPASEFEFFSSAVSSKTDQPPDDKAMR